MGSAKGILAWSDKEKVHGQLAVAASMFQVFVEKGIQQRVGLSVVVGVSRSPLCSSTCSTAGNDRRRLVRQALADFRDWSDAQVIQFPLAFCVLSWLYLSRNVAVRDIVGSWVLVALKDWLWLASGADVGAG